jgi:hypothetical protein
MDCVGSSRCKFPPISAQLTIEILVVDSYVNIHHDNMLSAIFMSNRSNIEIKCKKNGGIYDFKHPHLTGA